MTSESRFGHEKSHRKCESIQADLEIAIDYARLAWYSEDMNEIAKYRRTATFTFDEALRSLKNATLTVIELESIKTKIERLEYLLWASEIG